MADGAIDTIVLKYISKAWMNDDDCTVAAVTCKAIHNGAAKDSGDILCSLVSTMQH
jgi:hypothetical protein